MMCAARDLMKCSADNDAGKTQRAGPIWKFSPLSECTLRDLRFIDPPTLEPNIPYWIVFLWLFNPLPRHARFVAQVRVGAEIVIPEKISLYVVYKPKVKKFDFN